MHISILSVVVLLGSTALATPPPNHAPACVAVPDILKSCKDLVFGKGEPELSEHTLTATCQNCDGAWNPTSLDLDSVLGNKYGKFEWGGKDFSGSAYGQTTLDSKTGVLSAILRYSGGEDGSPTNDEQADVNLTERIHNVNGVLTFVPL